MSQKKYIYIYVHELFSAGKHSDIILYNYNFKIVSDNSSVPSVYYEIDTNSTYYIDVTKLDLENRNIAGNFEFTVVSTDKSDTIRVTDGKFDVYNVAIIE